eukprot:686565-Rhodomonas_salina.2
MGGHGGAGLRGCAVSCAGGAGCGDVSERLGGVQFTVLELLLCVLAFVWRGWRCSRLRDALCSDAQAMATFDNNGAWLQLRHLHKPPRWHEGGPANVRRLG